MNDLSLKGAFKTRGYDYDCNSEAFNTIEISLIAPLNDLFNTLDAVQTKQNHHKDKRQWIKVFFSFTEFQSTEAMISHTFNQTFRDCFK